HVVVSSHGVPVAEQVCMFVGGLGRDSLRLGLDNCEAVFATLKGKVAKDCVVWLGGCTIGQNREFCIKAARASGCPVVAAGKYLSTKSFPPGTVDLLDRSSMPIFYAPGEDKPGSLSDFCSKQDTYQFVVPV